MTASGYKAEADAIEQQAEKMARRILENQQGQFAPHSPGCACVDCKDWRKATAARFGSAVAAWGRKLVLDEREDCAKLAESF